MINQNFGGTLTLDLLQKRAKIIGEVRAFFDSRKYLPLDTPLLAPELIPESCLEVFETAWIPPAGSRQQPEKLWLIPSPEIWMKQLINLHEVNMYQICKCFRNAESRGHLHNPEFTMLEYYTMNADYLDSLAVTEDLFAYLRNVLPEVSLGPKEPFLRITMDEAFRTWAGFSLSEVILSGGETQIAGRNGFIGKNGRAALEREGRRLGLEPVPDTMDDLSAIALLYDLIFIHSVEPSLPKDRPVAILDYPAFVPCLAKNREDSKGYIIKERWELYFGGAELANCYSEETDPAEISRFFKEETAKKRQNARIKHRIAQNFPNNCRSKQEIRPYSGVAMGLDRLIMILCKKMYLENILPFPF